ncbi:hypothetical protein ACIRD8_22260 [Streptomyces sp. NPDC102451]
MIDDEVLTDAAAATGRRLGGAAVESGRRPGAPSGPDQVSVRGGAVS